MVGKVLKVLYMRFVLLLNTFICSLYVNKELLDTNPRSEPDQARNYTKFIVLGHQRTGSSMVVRALKKHPQILAFGELFTHYRVTFNEGGYDNFSNPLLYLRNRFPIDFLERYVFAPYDSPIKAVGFKLFPDQLDNRHSRCVWDWLRRNSDIKIVLLTRADLLGSYTSQLVAHKTGFHNIKDESERREVRVTIDFRKCLQEFERRDAYHREVLALVDGNDVLEVTYEEMTADLDAFFSRVQQFLGVDQSPPFVDSVKKEDRPISEVIENYSALRDQFSDTKWKYLFEG